MYDLGVQFKFDLEKSKPNPDSVIRGNKFRITILKDGLFRLEYNPEGIFNDLPTELVWYRNFSKPEFEVKEDENYLVITTKYAKITYTKEKPFLGSKVNPTNNLKVEVLGSDRYWYYGHPEVRNLGAPGEEVESKNGKAKYKKGLYSSDGFVTIDDSATKVFTESGVANARTNTGIDIYVFVYLNDFHVCLKDYYEITGYPALIPRYALGNWWSKNEEYDDGSLKTLIDDFMRHKIPLSVLLLDQDWHNKINDNKNNVETGFTFNKALFKAPYEMISYLHTKGIHLGLRINPFSGFYPVDEYYEKATTYLQPDKDGVIPFNIFDPKVIDVYMKLYIHPLDALGVDFYWLGDYDKDKTEEMTLLKHYHILDMARDYKRRPMVIAQNTLTAPHRYPVLYSGKTIVGWNALKTIPLYNASAANIGVSYWSHDIGGYHKGTEDNELYIRYVQLGVFSPIMKFGADRGKYYKREPWRWSIKTYAIAEDYLNMRHRMVPYLYSEAYKYSKFGTPVIQPIYYKYSDLYDDEIYRNQYFLGSEFFVSPIISKKDIVMNRVIHKFFIPDGVWYDFFTGKKFPGGRSYVSFFRDQDYPIFARAGSIIPFGYNDNINDLTPPKHMELHIFPGQSNTYDLYEDDGVSDLYKKEFFMISKIDYNYMPNNYTVIIRAVTGKSGIVPEKRDYKIIFRNTKRAEDVVVYCNQEKMNPELYESYTEGPDFIVILKETYSRDQITVNCKGRDIEFDAVRVINQDIDRILDDLQIETELKETIGGILFSELITIKKKRIEIRKLKSKGLKPEFIKLFLKLLDYVNQV